MLVLSTPLRAIATVAFDPDGPGLAAAGRGGVGRWANPIDDPVAKILTTEAAESAGVTPEGFVAVAMLGGGVQVFGPTNRTLLPGVQDVRAAASPAAPLVVTRPPRGTGPLTGWRLAADQPPDPVWTADNDTELSDLMFTADGAWLIHRDYRWWAKKKRWLSWVVTRDPATGSVTRSVELRDTGAWARAAVSQDGEWLAVLTGMRSAVIVRRIAAAAPVAWHVVKEGKRDLTDVAFHPAGRLLAVTSNDEVVRLYDATTGEPAGSFEWEIGRLRCVAFSADGTRAAAGSDAGKVVVWDVDD